MSLVVERAPVRKPHRGPDPAPLVLVAIIAFVALAIAKPWQPAPPPAPSETSAPAPSQSNAAAASPSPSSSALAASPTPAPESGGGQATVGPLQWSDLLGALTPQTQYGLRVVTRANAVLPATLPAGALASEPNVTASIGGAYHVTWLPANGVDDPVMVVDPDAGSPILAIGVTAHAGLAPLDLRFWRLVRGRPPERLSPSAVSGDPVLGDRLFLPPAEDGAVAGWQPGSYYVDLLEGGSVERFEFELWTGDPPRDPPRRFNPPPPLDEVVKLDALGIANGVAGLPRAPFTIDISGHGHGWVADPGPPLDDAAAWLAEAAIPIAPTVLGTTVANGQVARAYGPEPAAIGVILPRGAVVSSARLVSLAPEAGVVGDAPLVGPIGPAVTTTEQGAPRREANFSQRAFVAFVPRETDTWPAGVYRIDVTYTSAAGLKTTASWHIDVAATAATRASAAVPALLDAAYHWFSVPSGWAILTGGTMPRGGTTSPAPGPIVVWSDPPLAPDPTAPFDPPDPPGSVVCENSAVLNAQRTVIGISVPASVADVDIHVVRVFPGIGGVLLPAVISRGVQPGLWLLAPPASGGRSWPSGRYQIDLSSHGIAPPSFEGVYRACFGAFASVNPTFSLAPGALSVEQYRAARLEPGALTWAVLQPGRDPVTLEQ